MAEEEGLELQQAGEITVRGDRLMLCRALSDHHPIDRPRARRRSVGRVVGIAAGGRRRDPLRFAVAVPLLCTLR
jgi:hypothetical protein